MNKITKIGVLGLALCMLLSALHTSATPDVDLRKKLELKITSRSSSCDMSEYNLGSFEVLDTDRTIALTGANMVKCYLRENPARQITLQLLSGLTDSSISKTIDKSKFTFDLSNVSVNGSLSAGSAKNGSLGSPTQLYSKEANKIGVWSGTLKIGGTIPGGTPSGTYTGELNLLIQP